MHIRLPSLCPDSRDGCTRRKGDRRGACLCVHVSVCVCVCVSIYRAYIHVCASFQKRVHAFFEGYSDEDARYVRVYAVHGEI